MYIIIIGCSQVGAKLASLLSQEGNDVVIVDKKREAFKKIGQGFNGLTIVGDGFDEEVLKEAGIEQANVFVAVTDNDNINIVAAQVAKKIYNVPRVLVRIYDAEREDLYQQLGLEVIGTTSLMAGLIKEKIMGEIKEE